MKQCVKCRQQIDDTLDVCPYCGQWQAQVKETEVIKNAKSCVKCRQQIPLDCKECTFCGQIQPVEKTDCEINTDELEKSDKKKQWKIALAVLGAGVLLFVCILGLIMWSPPKTEPVDTSSYTDATQTTTESIVVMNECIVEESDNDTGGRIIYNFDEFWGKYEEMFLSVNATSENPASRQEIENYIDGLSNLSRYEATNGNQTESNKAVTIYTPTYDWILSELSTTISIESDSEKIMSVMTIIQDGASKTHSAYCVSVMCNTSFTDAMNLINDSMETVIENENSICVYNNITFLYSTSNDVLTLTLYASSDEYIERLGEKKDLVYLNLTEESQQSTDVVNKENMVIESDNDLGYIFNMNLDEFCVLFNNADDAIGLGSEYDVIQGDLIHANESESFYGKPHTLYTSSNTEVGGMSIAVENESKNVSRFQACITGDAYGTDNTETIKLNRTKSMIKMLNPDLDNSEIQSLAEQLFNSDDIDTNQNRYLYYNNIGYSINEIAGGIWITAEPMTKEYYNSRISDSSENRVSFGDYSLVLPDDWTYVDDGYGNITFYEKYNYTNNTDILGVLVSIEKWSTPVGDDYHFQYENLGEKNGYFYYAFWPSGIGISNDQTANEKYESARAEIDSVLDSFEFN